MSKIQGKQVADQTIEQKHLLLSTPTSGDTISGATVGYVNNQLIAGGDITIGPAESGDLVYTDGIFTDFTTGTTVGTAVDRFNEMFKLLAPTPPSGTWTSAFSTPLPTLSTSTLTSTTRMIGTGAATTNVVASTLTPAFTIASTVGMGALAKSKDGTFVFTIRDYNGNVLETKTINSSSTTDLTGTLRYNVGDPYNGISGQQGFWTGVTGLSGVSFTSSSITAGTTARNLYFEHPNGIGKTGTTFYVDNVTVNTPSVVSLVMGTLPTMTRYISGVPSLATSATFPITSFSISNVCTYFYAPNPIWASTSQIGVTAFSGDITNTPSSVGDTGLVGAQTVTISNTYTESISFTIQAKNRSNSLAGGTTGFTSSAYRYDGSNESTRLTSGTGNYPSTGWGGTWGTNSGVSLLTNTDELQMLNTYYRYPTVNYSTNYAGGPNYSGISGIRWVTLNGGSISSAVNVLLTFTGMNGLLASAAQSGVYIQAMVSGVTYWVDANNSYDTVSNPGDLSDGVGSVTNYTTSTRSITFGTKARTGNLIVRVGLSESVAASVYFQSVAATKVS